MKGLRRAMKYLQMTHFGRVTLYLIKERSMGFKF